MILKIEMKVVEKVVRVTVRADGEKRVSAAGPWMWKKREGTDDGV